MKLFRSPEMPGHWIGQDRAGGMVVWPIEPGGWSKRTPYTGPRRPLQEVSPAEARGTGWPGAGGGRPPRAGGKPGKLVGIRASDEERSAWAAEADAEDKALSEWARDELNAAAERRRRERGS